MKRFNVKRFTVGLGALALFLMMSMAFIGCEGPAGPDGPAGPGGQNGLGVITDGPRIIVVGAGISGMIAALSAADTLAETGGGQVMGARRRGR